MLRKMGNKLDRLEDDIFEGRSSEIVRDLSNAKQEIINFRKIVRPQRAVLRDLERTKQRYLAEELEIYFDDISDAAERIWDTLENYKEVVEALESTNESVLSHRLNDSFRILTAASVILLPLTLIASIFGMNVHFPGEGEAFSFFAILGLMALVLIALTLYFRRRGWLSPRRAEARTAVKWPRSAMLPVTTSTELDQARAAFARHAWGEAIAARTPRPIAKERSAPPTSARPDSPHISSVTTTRQPP